MSRLIDADAMKQHYPIMENDFGMVFNEGLHKKLDLEPTVKAIPIEVVEQIRKEIADLWHYYPMGHDYEIAINRCLGIIDKALKEQNE